MFLDIAKKINDIMYYRYNKVPFVKTNLSTMFAKKTIISSAVGELLKLILFSVLLLNCLLKYVSESLQYLGDIDRIIFLQRYFPKFPKFPR